MNQATAKQIASEHTQTTLAPAPTTEATDMRRERIETHEVAHLNEVLDGVCKRVVCKTEWVQYPNPTLKKVINEVL
jgi:hypothetical protein